MNKLIIFDLDGVLMESREVHYEALNSALFNVDPKFVITREEHLSTFDGLNTTKKLQLLTASKNLPTKYYDQIWQDKQATTIEIIKKYPRSHLLCYWFEKIKQLDYKIAVASNSIRETVKQALISLDLIKMVDYWVSNEDVKRTKPYPEMYWKCMTALNCLPKDTIIVEDSHIGRQGAIDSGAHLVPVENSSELTDPEGQGFSRIFQKMKELEDSKTISVKWSDKKLNVLIPMAGAGSRFSSAGYTFPKPLIEVNGKPMIQVVVENLNIDANYTFIVQKEHYEKYSLKYLLNLVAPNCNIVQVDGLTEGAACTALLAKEFINSENPLVIANSDQYVDWNSNEVMYAFRADEIDGGIVTFKASHPKWSYAKLDSDGFVSRVAEKQVISDLATVGIYYWKHGADFVKYAEQMIEKNIRVNNEFYVAPVFNQAIEDGKKFRTKNVNEMWGIGTPEDLEFFLRNRK